MEDCTLKNFVQEGHTLDYVAPAGGVVAGVALLIGTVLVVPAITAPEGAPFSGWIEGVYTLPCATGTAWATPNIPLFWNDVDKRVTTTENGNTKIGMTAAPKAAAAASGNVKLLPNV
jgi:predicted RecA/RadA family phage recombinase